MSEQVKVNYREWVRTLIARKGEDAHEEIAKELEDLERMRAKAQKGWDETILLADQAINCYERMK